jgi:hypothetical protein
MRLVIGISFDASSPHRLRAIGEKPAEAIWFVVGRQNDARGAALGSGVEDATPPRVA